MRGVFDQYSVPENQLTHALMTSLACDAELAEAFLRLAGLRESPKKPMFLQQSLPGELRQLTEGEAEDRRLPDGVIYEPDRYSILLESKVASPPDADQLQGHFRTAMRNGFANPSVLLVTVKPLLPTFEAPWLRVLTWSEVYAWLRVRPRGFWSDQLLRFLEAKEARWSNENYLREGTLTTFAGIPFDNADEPYDYFQAKRLIKLMRRDLLKHPALRTLGADLESEGRHAITGRNEDRVWDMIPIRAESTEDAFNQNVHLTFAILRDCLQAYVTIPNGIRSRRRTQLLGPSAEEFGNVVARITKNFDRLIQREPTARPAIVVVQRAYQTQRAVPDVHAQLRFDPRTYFEARASRVKHQPQWFVAAYDALKNRRSNLQLQIGIDFPYASCAKVRSAEAIDLVAETWEACRPAIEAVGD